VAKQAGLTAMVKRSSDYWLRDCILRSLSKKVTLPSNAEPLIVVEGFCGERNQTVFGVAILTDRK